MARKQHGTIAHDQLRALGYTDGAIRHRLRTGRLHRLWPGVYAVGRPTVSREGRWMAATLTCGEGACVSHESAAQLLGIWRPGGGPIHVTVPGRRRPRRRGLEVHRRRLTAGDVIEKDGIPTTNPVLTLIDLAARHGAATVERAVGQADATNLIDPEALRAALEVAPPRPGLAKLKRILDRHTFVLTHSELERRFIAIVRRAGLGPPQGQRRLGPHRVDFFWPELDLVVETDGLTYHRTAAQQAEDLRRDHAHAAAGRTTLRFSHAQIAYEADHVERILAAVARRLKARPG